jgi:hypothetical protein
MILLEAKHPRLESRGLCSMLETDRNTQRLVATANHVRNIGHHGIDTLSERHTPE